jgi:16S rRNA (cytosine967-C5)-methyltransferase
VQDASSQLVAPFSEVKPGMTVIDACAGAGGKTLHLATQMKNQGQLFAYDIYQSKIDELNKRAKRNGVRILAQTAVITPKHIKRNTEIADVLLIDAPCSSLGTLRRKPDLKWKLNPAKIAQIKVIQQDILSKYASMLKKNGLLIYVTCSILPEENQDNVKSFLEQNKNFIFVEDKTILPSQSGHDGFYMAKLLKTQ